MLGGLGVMKKAGWYEASLWCVTMDNGAPRSRHVTPPQANHRQNISAHASYYSCPQHTAWWRSHAIHHQNLHPPWKMPIPPTLCLPGKGPPPLYKMFCHHPPHIRHPGISPHITCIMLKCSWLPLTVAPHLEHNENISAHA